MTIGQIGTAARDLGRLFGEGTVAGLSDAQLLGRFAADRDEAAFEALVARHGPMVLAVCRGVLRDPHEAQDAFQATFLVLVRKAGTVRADGSLGGWLYRVARRVAAQAGSGASRRRRVERQGVEVDALTPARPRAAGDRDPTPALLEEVDRLPAKYRDPVVLCYLQGLTYEEAAGRLGWPSGTVSGRLAKARELLRGRLTRRGVALPAAWLGSGPASEASAAVPAAWSEATIRLATGRAATSASASAVALGDGFLRGLALARLKAAGLGLVAAGVLAGLAATRVAGRGEVPGGPAPAAQVPSATKRGEAIVAADQDPKPEPVPIAGRVLDPAGRPLAGASLYVRHNHWGRLDREADAVERVASSGPDGMFRFDLDRARSDVARGEGPPWMEAEIAAVAPGLGLAWISAGDAAKAGGGAELRLVPDDLPIRGRILDDQGRPVAGATVRVQAIAAPASADPDGLLASGRFDWDGMMTKLERGPTWTTPTWIGQGGATTTGGDGRFELRGLGRGRVASLRVEAAGLERSTIAVMARPAPARPASRPGPSATFDPFYGEMGLRLFGAEFEHILGPSKPIVGVVRAKGTGRPVPGVTVTGQVRGRVQPVVMTTTDDQGRYRIAGLPKAEGYRVDVRPEPGTSFFASGTVPVGDTDGLKPIDLDLELPTGVAVGVRLLDKATGRAVACDWLQYVPLPENPSRGNLHGIAPGPDLAGKITVPTGRGLIVAKARGRAHPYPPARLAPADKGKLVVRGEDGAEFGFDLSLYNAYRIVEIAEGTEAIAVDLEASPGLTVKAELVGPDGRPVAGAKAMGLTSDPFASASIEGASFEVVGLRADEPRRARFRHERLDLAGSVEVRAPGPEAGPGPLVVRLDACGAIAGRLVDRDGVPLVGAKVSAYVTGRYGPSDPLFRPREGVTDRDGRFRVAGLDPSEPATLLFKDPNHPAPAFTTKPEKDLGKLSARPGATLDLGDVRVRADRIN